MDFFFCLIIDIAVFWLVWSLSLLLFIQHGTNKELVPVHSTEDRFMPDTKWDRDCCAATVSELPMAWTVFKPHQVQRKEMISWYTLGYTPLSTLTLTWTTTNRLCVFCLSVFSQLQNSGETCVQSDLQENHFSGMAMLSRIPWRRLQRGWGSSFFADLKFTEAFPNHLNDCKTKELLDVVSQLHRHLLVVFAKTSKT